MGRVDPSRARSAGRPRPPDRCPDNPTIPPGSHLKGKLAPGVRTPKARRGPTPSPNRQFRRRTDRGVPASPKRRLDSGHLCTVPAPRAPRSWRTIDQRAYLYSAGERSRIVCPPNTCRPPSNPHLAWYGRRRNHVPGRRCARRSCAPTRSDLSAVPRWHTTVPHRATSLVGCAIPHCIPLHPHSPRPSAPSAAATPRSTRCWWRGAGA